MSIKDDKLSPYAPIRQRGLLWWKYAKLAGKDGHIAANGMISAELPQMIEKYLMAAYVTQFHEVTKNQPNAGYLVGVHVAKVEMFRHWVPIAAQYELCGRQLFDLDDGLVEMLRETSLGECTFEGLNLPYDAFYVRFGKQDGVKINFEGEDVMNSYSGSPDLFQQRLLLARFGLPHTRNHIPEGMVSHIQKHIKNQQFGFGQVCILRLNKAPQHNIQLQQTAPRTPHHTFAVYSFLFAVNY